MCTAIKLRRPDGCWVLIESIIVIRSFFGDEWCLAKGPHPAQAEQGLKINPYAYLRIAIT